MILKFLTANLYIIPANYMIMTTSYLSIEEKIQALAIARDLAAASGAASGKAGVVEMFRTLLGRVLEDTGGPDCSSLCYAVADQKDGTAKLTVFEGDTGASVET